VGVAGVAGGEAQRAGQSHVARERGGHEAAAARRPSPSLLLAPLYPPGWAEEGRGPAVCYVTS